MGESGQSPPYDLRNLEHYTLFHAYANDFMVNPALIHIHSNVSKGTVID